MSAYLYDEQLALKIKNWCKHVSGLQIYGPNETRRLFEVIADQINDKPIELPLITISRSGYEIINPNKKPTTYDGLTLMAGEDDSLQLNMVPINLSYQLDVYTRYYQEADIYIRNLIFNLINYPTLTVVVPSEEKEITHHATVRVLTDVQDNSDVPEVHLVSGQFTRLTLQLTIDDAYLWDARIRDNVYIDDFNLEVKL